MTDMSNGNSTEQGENKSLKAEAADASIINTTNKTEGCGGGCGCSPQASQTSLAPSHKAPNILPMIIGALILGGVLGAGITQSLNKGHKKEGGDEMGVCAAPNAGGATENVALIDGKAVTLSDFPPELQDAMYESQIKSHTELSTFVKRQLALHILAKEAGKPGAINQTIEEASLIQVTPMPDEQLKQIYEQNKAYLGNKTFEEVKPMIIERIGAQQRVGVLDSKANSLEKEGKFMITLPKPIARKVDLDLAGLPYTGSDTAAHTVVLATDFLCGHCRHRWSEFRTAMKDNPTLKVVHINFPLSPGFQTEMAKAAYCVVKVKGNEAYFKFVDAAMSVNPPDNALKEFEPYVLGTLKDYMTEMEASACMKDPASAAFVEKQKAALNKFGVNGTPAMYVNGRKELLPDGAFPERLKALASGK